MYIDTGALKLITHRGGRRIKLWRVMATDIRVSRLRFTPPFKGSQRISGIPGGSSAFCCFFLR